MVPLHATASGANPEAVLSAREEQLLVRAGTERESVEADERDELLLTLGRRYHSCTRDRETGRFAATSKPSRMDSLAS